jgi:hypothetical protein
MSLSPIWSSVLPAKSLLTGRALAKKTKREGQLPPRGEAADLTDHESAWAGNPQSDSDDVLRRAQASDSPVSAEPLRYDTAGQGAAQASIPSFALVADASGVAASATGPGATAQGAAVATPAAGAAAFGLTLLGGTLMVASAGRSDAMAPSSPSTRTFRVIDGYVSGAQVYIDADRDGVADANEIIEGAVTNERGEVTLPTSALRGPLIAVGGINTDTRLPNRMPILAPEGSTVLTPLTTLAQFMILDGSAASSGEAADRVMRALGLVLPEGESLLSYDPVSSDDPVLHRAGVAVATLFELASGDSLVDGLQALHELSQSLAQSSRNGRTVDLFGDATEVRSALLDIGLGQNAASFITAALSDFRTVSTITDIAKRQKQTLSPPAPFAPVLEVAPLFSTSVPSGLVKLNLGTVSSGYRAPVEGDVLVIELFRGNHSLGTRELVLGKDAIATGSVDIAPSTPLDEGVYQVKARVQNAVGIASGEASAAFTVDAIAAAAQRISIDAAGQPLGAKLSAGSRIAATVSFDDPVTVSGHPALKMQVGGQDVLAQHDAQASTPNALVFSYVLPRAAKGIEIAPDGVQAEPGTIVDVLGRSASLTVPPVFTNGFVFKANGADIDAATPYTVGSAAGAAQTFQVSLGGRPKSEVTLVLESGDGSEAVLRKTVNGKSTTAPLITLQFTPDNWNLPQSFETVLVDDGLNDSPDFIPVFATARSQDSMFDNLRSGDGLAGSSFGIAGLPMAPAELALKLDGVSLTPASAISLLPIEGAASAPKQLAIALSRAPTDTVWLTLKGVGDDFTIEGSSAGMARVLEFSPKDWNQAQTIDLRPAVLPGLLSSNQDQLVFTTKSADPGFNNLTLTVDVNANDVALVSTPAGLGWVPVGQDIPVGQNIVDTIQLGVQRLVDQVVTESLPLIGQAGKDLVSSLTSALLSPTSFVFDQVTGNFVLEIDKSLDVLTLPLASDLGFSIGDPSSPLIAFDLDAQAEVAVNVRLMLEGQIDMSELSAGSLANALVLRPFDPGSNNGAGDDLGSQLRLDLSVTVPGAMSGTLGPFTVTATDQKAVNEALQRDMGTGFLGRVEINVVEDNVTPGVRIGDLVANPEQAIELRTGISGQLSTKVAADLRTGIDFFDFFLPSVSFDLGIPFESQIAQSGSQTNGSAATKVLLDHVVLDLGDVFDYITPVLQIFDPILQTIRPLVDVFQLDLLSRIKIEPYQFNQDDWKWYDYITPGWKLARELIKEWASDEIADWVVNTVRSFDGSIDGKKDGKVTLLEAVRSNLKNTDTDPSQKSALGLIQTVSDVLDYLNLYYSVTDKLRDNTGLVNLKQGLDLGSLVIGPEGVDQSTPNSPGASGSFVAPGAWTAIPASGQPNLPSAYELLGKVSPEAQVLVDDLSDLGVTFPFLTDNILISKILTLQPVDLVEFRPKIPEIKSSFNLELLDMVDLLAQFVPSFYPVLAAVRNFQIPGAEKIRFNAPLSVDGAFSLDSKLAIGLDTAGINAWVKNGMRADLAGAADLLDGVYLSDNVVNGVDQPELAGAYSLQLLLSLMVGGRDYGVAVDAHAGLGIEGRYELDLEDGGEQAGGGDGKVRASEIVAGITSPGADGKLDLLDVLTNLMPGGPLYDFDIDAGARVDLGARLDLDIEKAKSGTLSLFPLSQNTSPVAICSPALRGSLAQVGFSI